MASYTFELDWFKITDTRSHQNDTDIAGFVVAVNDKVYGPQIANTSDVDNGTFDFESKGLKSLTDVTIDDGDKFAFAYAMYNNGSSSHPNSTELSQYLTQAAQAAIAKVTPPQLIGIDSSAAPVAGDPDDHPTTLDLVSGILFPVLFDALSYLQKDCDGIVAIGGMAGDGASLTASLASSGGVHSQQDVSNAKKLGFGAPCNSSGSNYVVAWTVGVEASGPPQSSEAQKGQPAGPPAVHPSPKRPIPR
jgi:hypothetical protein